MIVTTGASGFIGKKLLVQIRKKYRREEIFIVDPKKHNLVTGNLDLLPKSPRLIFHLAAATDTSKSDQRCNNIGTKNLLNALGKIGPKTHLIFTSSQAIFSGRKDCRKPVDQKTKPEPNNKYGRTKLEAEKILLKAAKRQNFKLTIIRLPTTWGDNPRKNSFLNFLKGFVKTNSIISRLNYPGKIGLIYVDDAVKSILDSTVKPSRVISIATENLTLTEIFEKLTKSRRKIYRQIRLPDFIWNVAKSLRRYIGYFEPILPAFLYNYLWRASIVIDSPLWCRENIRGTKFTS